MDNTKRGGKIRPFLLPRFQKIYWPQPFSMEPGEALHRSISDTPIVRNAFYQRHLPRHKERYQALVENPQSLLFLYNTGVQVKKL